MYAVVHVVIDIKDEGYAIVNGDVDCGKYVNVVHDVELMLMLMVMCMCMCLCMRLCRFLCRLMLMCV